MNKFNNPHLNIQDVFSLLKSPRDLSKPEFSNLLLFFGDPFGRIMVDGDKTRNLFVKLGICKSNSDFKKSLGGLFVGKRKITDFNDVIDVDEMFEIASEENDFQWKWASIRRGKNANFIIYSPQREEWANFVLQELMVKKLGVHND